MSFLCVGVLKCMVFWGWFPHLKPKFHCAIIYLLGCQIILRFCTGYDCTIIKCACSVAASACWKQSRNKRVNANHSCQRIFFVPVMQFFPDAAGGCFTNVSRAPQNTLAKIYNTRNHIYGETLYVCQSKALGIRTKFQLEILIISIICAIHKFRENFLESSRNISETTPICVSGAGEEGRGRSWLCWFTVFSRR